MALKFSDMKNRKRNRLFVRCCGDDERLGMEMVGKQEWRETDGEALPKRHRGGAEEALHFAPFQP